VCELYGVNADGAGAAVDEDALSVLEMGAVEQPLPCGEPRDRHNGSVDVIDRCGLARDLGRLGDAVLGIGAIDEPVVEAVCRVAGAQRGHVVAQLRNFAGELVAENDRYRSRGTRSRDRSGRPLDLRRRHPGRMDPNQHLPGLGTRVRSILVSERSQISAYVQSGRLHSGTPSVTFTLRSKWTELQGTGSISSPHLVLSRREEALEQSAARHSQELSLYRSKPSSFLS
jgi:hypothetical protein